MTPAIQPDRPASELTVAVVVPVRGHGELLTGLLECLARQDRRPDHIVLADDSPDGSLEPPTPDLTVVRSGGVGPYGARNRAWRSVEADVYLFVDARSRPRDTWCGALTALFAEPDVDLAGSEINVLPGPTLPARAAHAEQLFAVRGYVDQPWFLPYFPTCNLGIRRSALERVQGFGEVRSGGDADLCWRVIESGGGYAVDRSVQLDWVPRVKVRDFLEQRYRYGGSNVALRRSWAGRGMAAPVPPALGDLARRAALIALRTPWAAVRRREDRLQAQLLASAYVARDLGVRRALRRAEG
ncbi:glycosyltransferase [Nocardioides mangrovicus]|uniref:glycosyltransferase n=1 Tax=Nocardioides mangrovicus TaxID=2478913 RepID=UPI0013145D35|nr:glycosyltransferase [Nocardioides mangrovicus]